MQPFRLFGRLTGVAGDLTSRYVLLPALHATRRARKSTRDSERSFAEGLRVRHAQQTWPEEQRRQWILERLRDAVRYAANETPFYADLFKRVGFDPAKDFSFDEFASLPVLERSSLREDGARMRAASVPDGLARRDSTGGSTGAPVHYMTGPAERGWSASASETFMRSIGLPEGRRIALFWAHHLDPLDRSALADRVRDRVQNVRWYDCLRLDPDRLISYHYAMERFQPDGIIAYAGALAALAETLESRGLRPSYPRRALVTGAEKLWPHWRQAIERVFTAPLSERYGSRDVGSIGFQLRPRESAALAIDWANLLVEPESDAADSAILVTKLHADAQPMIRYRIGDVARFPAGSRPGHPTFVLEEVLGRQTDRIWAPNGRWVHGIGVPHLLKDFPIDEFQLVQQADYSVELRVVPRPEFSDADRATILGVLRANLGEALIIRVELTERIDRPAGKWRPVVSHVQQDPISRGAA
jgi:phenylacetate-CoA ligase